MIWRSCITHRFVSLMFSCTIGVPKGPLFALFALATWVLRKDAHAGTLDAAKVSQCSSRDRHPNQVVHFDFFRSRWHSWRNIWRSIIDRMSTSVQSSHSIPRCRVSKWVWWTWWTGHRIEDWGGPISKGQVSDSTRDKSRASIKLIGLSLVHHD